MRSITRATFAVAVAAVCLVGCAMRSAKSETTSRETAAHSQGFGNYNIGFGNSWNTTVDDAGVHTLQVGVLTMPDAGITGTFTASGPGASGAAVSGNPVRVAGSDGTNTRDVKTDTSGNQIVVGAAAAGAAVAGNPVLIGGSDGTNARTASIDSSGAFAIQSGGTTGSAVPARAVQVGGTDGTNLRALKTDSSGDQVVVGAGTAGSASGGVMTVQGSASGTAIPVTPSLPTGASTAAKQPALGTAGTASADVISVQGIASMTALTVGGAGTAGSASGGVLTVQGSASGTAIPVSDSHVPVNGQATMANSVPVVIASNQSSLTTASATSANTSYWSGITSASTQSSTALDTAGYRYGCFYITELSTSTPVGTFAIEQSIDNSNFQAIYLDVNRPQGSNFAAFAGGTTISVSSPGGTVSIFVCVEKMMRYLRITYTRSSGGTTSTINAQSYLSN